MKPVFAARTSTSVAAEQMVRAAERDRRACAVCTVYSGVRMIDEMRSSSDACVMSRAMSYADDTLSDSRPDGSA